MEPGEYQAFPYISRPVDGNARHAQPTATGAPQATSVNSIKASTGALRADWVGYIV
jgi:hypothetical protein